jgi:DNA-binding NarL/FixJ family response regulator
MVATDVMRTLEQLGYEVAGEVSPGDDAVRAAEEVRPDHIVMDPRTGRED